MQIRVFCMDDPVFAHSAEKIYFHLIDQLIQQSIIILMENMNFRKLLGLIEKQDNLSETLKAREQEYLIKLYKIRDLKAGSVDQLYQNMQRKFYINRKKQNEEFWYENQLRIFVWLLFGYLDVYQREITDLKEEDWNYFSSIFNFKSPVFFQFQALSIVRAKGRPAPWCEAETNFLEQIISEKKYKNRWNSIARELFIKSGKLYFRNPKQCRQRWMNHLDPAKIRSEWTQSEDIILLNTIKKKGKKWSLAVRQLQNTRTEHMVKNRYKSLISNESKKYPEKRQAQIQKNLLKRLVKMQQQKVKNIIPRQDQLEQQIQRESAEQVRSEMVHEGVRIEIKHQENEYAQILPQNYNFHDDEQAGKSEVHVSWRAEEVRNSPMNFMEDDQIEIENHLYNFSEPENESFLGF